MTTKTPTFDADKLAALAHLIEKLHRHSFAKLCVHLAAEEGMKLTPIRNGGGSSCRMAGITATSTSGDHGAVTNWANAARRQLLMFASDEAAAQPDGKIIEGPF